MRISIWQQWTSNHSATYDVVGVFRTVDAAKEAGNVVERFLTEFIEWYIENGTQTRTEEAKSKPNPIEQRYAEAYGFDWQEPIDWMQPYPWNWSESNYRRTPLDHLFVYDRLVGIHAFNVATWQTGHQFANLLSKLGGMPYRDVYMGYRPDGDMEYRRLTFSVTCVAPSETLAAEIGNIIERSVEQPQNRPWGAFHPHYARITYVASRERYAKWILEVPNDDIFYRPPFGKIVSQLVREANLHEPQCLTEGNQLTVKASGAYNIAAVLPALLAWLKAQGCSNIDYSLEEREA